MASAPQQPMAVIGAGSWGTALAIQLARAGHPVHLWGRDVAQLDALQRARCNERYLPDAAFPQALLVCKDLARALDGVRDALIAVPSHAFRATVEQVEKHLRPDTRIAWATKGFEASSGLLPHQVAADVLGSRPGAVLSGPTFAKEVGAGLPTAMTVASRDAAFAKALASRLSGPNFRAYMQTDILGVEVGGAVKNVIAIGSGIADGMGFGANTRVALITRGLAEMMRLGVRLGAVRETFMGLAGLGDLVLTCTDNQSRNRRLGLALDADIPCRRRRPHTSSGGRRTGRTSGLHGGGASGGGHAHMPRSLSHRPRRQGGTRSGTRSHGTRDALRVGVIRPR